MQDNITTTQAQEYAESIAETLRAWDYISDAWTEAQDHEDPTRYAGVWLRWRATHEADPVQAERMRCAVSEIDDIGGFEFIEEQGGVGMAWGHGTLDAYAITHTRPGDDNNTDVQSAEFLVSFGGPSCYVRNHGGTYSDVTVYWGSDTGRARVACQAVEDAAEALMDAVTYGY